MNWSDEGYVLSVRRHGEAAAIVNLLTREHGRHAGLVRGGAGRRLRGVLQPGNQVAADWRGRLAEHLGSYTVEAMRDHAAALLADGDRLAGLTAATAVTEAALPEREPHLAIHDGFAALLAALAGTPNWAAIYVRFELGLLAELGFGLDLSHCAATGSTEDLAYVSPRSARAVSREAASPYKEKLLPLPSFLLPEAGEKLVRQDILDGLKLTGYFLQSAVFAPHNRPLPMARERLVERISRQAE
ncbi:MAG: DNA repair protein RecO [Rhodospirillaceae bacterium]|jgi:DNA repair protein RecO (recombination protein O)|nr:DNA repair protein RecO [Rhodospirillaceae bacterium]MBT3493533.1 DNA repair protein RecO [Rhodospirillaceae bacterium]MBT3779048.1 DNA repair protein RecO [Rhodospirillaceae bacterium]MBT3976872.1 DNA repair protein RecO [Rhodospirillaceae bacterium]MBT4168251.1 DNA repair protein RecO [Rhodospirillaceae bacterium]